MLRYMLDTNLCVRLLRDRPQGLRARFNKEAGGLCVSSIVLYELLYGAAKSARPEHNRREVEHFVERMAVLDLDAEAAGHAGEIRAELERQGRVVGAYDLLVAGHARSRGLVLVTGNLDEFRRVDGLRSEDWLAPEVRAMSAPAGSWPDGESGRTQG